ncbi:hypothetical protein D3C76_169800 [compost metagenome]
MSDPLYIVRRPFRSKGRFFNAGDLIYDLYEEVKLPKIKLSEKKIVLVPKEGYEREALKGYFEHRRGMDLEAILEEGASKGSRVAEPQDTGTKATNPTPGTPEVKAEAPKVPEAPKHPMPEVKPVAAPAANPVVKPAAPKPPATK